MTLFDLFGTLPRCRLPEAKSATSSSLFLDGDLEESFPTKVFLRKSLAFSSGLFPHHQCRAGSLPNSSFKNLSEATMKTFSSSSPAALVWGRFCRIRDCFPDPLSRFKENKRNGQIVHVCCESQTKRAFCTYTNMKSSV